MSKYPSDENILFSSVELTNDYADTSSGAIECRSDDKFSILAKYAAGATETGNTCELEISFSHNGTDFFQYGKWADAATSTFTAYTFQLAQDTSTPINIESLGRYIRIRAKETGVAANEGNITLILYKNKS